MVVANLSARQARVKAIVQMPHLVITAPDQFHSQLKARVGLTTSLGRHDALLVERFSRTEEGGGRRNATERP